MSEEEVKVLARNKRAAAKRVAELRRQRSAYLGAVRGAGRKVGEELTYEEQELIHMEEQIRMGGNVPTGTRIEAGRRARESVKRRERYRSVAGEYGPAASVEDVVLRGSGLRVQLKGTVHRVESESPNPGGGNPAGRR